MEAFNVHKDKKEERPITNLLGNLTRSQQNEIEEMLHKSTFVIHHGHYVYAKVNSKPEKGKHLMVFDDDSEITVITKEENLRDLDLLERNKEDYALIRLTPSAPSSIGFLAAISDVLAKQKISIMSVSSYSKDYLLINVKHLENAKKALTTLGLKELKM